jgi:hypothetical protein
MILCGIHKNFVKKEKRRRAKPIIKFGTIETKQNKLTCSIKIWRTDFYSAVDLCFCSSSQHTYPEKKKYLI